VALDRLSFSVPERTMVGFVGPNGAGKTTAMRIVFGLQRADAGEVRWRGAPVDAAAQARIGYMPEERGLYPKMRVHEHLVYLARITGMQEADARRAAESWIARFGLDERAQDRVEELSLGNQQRVQLAGALVHAPDLLVLDEPFSGLDPVGVDVMSSVLSDQVASGAAVVFSSHQLELVERLCHSVVIINKGRLVAAGTVEELRSREGRRLVRVEGVPQALDRAAGVPGVAVVDKTERAVVLELGGGADPADVLDGARSGGPVTHFSLEQPTLAELFREAVAG